MLALVWTMRFMLVEDIYTVSKVKEMQNTANTIEDNIDHESLDELVTKLSFSNSTSIRIINSSGEVLYSADANFAMLQSLSDTSLYSKYQLALENDGEYISYSLFDDLFSTEDDVQFSESTKNQQDNAVNILYAKVMTADSGETYCIIMDSTVIPLVSDNYSGIILLIIASICIIIFVILIAFILGQYIAEPIKLVTSTATEIKNGNYNVDQMCCGTHPFYSKNGGDDHPNCNGHRDEYHFEYFC